MTDVQHDFDAAESAAREFDKQFERYQEHQARTSGARSRAVSTGGMDSMAKIVSGAADKALGAIEKALDGLAAHSKDVSGGIRKMSQNHLDLEEKLAADYKKIIEEHDTTPVYLLDRDGRVHRLNADGSRSGIEGDNSGIRHFFGDDGVARHIPPGEQNVTDKTLPKVDSQKIRPGSTELARAVDRARLGAKEDGSGDYGSPSSKVKANYAALHYQDGDKNFILVASSKFMGYHSEKRIGTPILDQHIGDNVRALYTERAPCDSASNCGIWLKSNFPNLTDVTHGFDYPGNEEHARHVETLRDRHFQIFRRPR